MRWTDLQELQSTKITSIFIEYLSVGVARPGIYAEAWATILFLYLASRMSPSVFLRWSVIKGCSNVEKSRVSFSPWDQPIAREKLLKSFGTVDIFLEVWNIDCKLSSGARFFLVPKIPYLETSFYGRHFANLLTFQRQSLIFWAFLIRQTLTMADYGFVHCQYLIFRTILEYIFEIFVVGFI